MIVRSAYDFPNWLINGNNYEAYEIVAYDNGLGSLLLFMFIPIIIFYVLVGLILAFRKGKILKLMQIINSRDV